MARVTDNGISGAVGNVVFYTMNGKRYVRAKPGPRKKKRGQPVNPLNAVFGTVSKYGSAMVKAMNGHFLFPLKRETYNRLRGWMRNQYAEHKDEEIWELSVRNSGMCQVNGGIDLRDFLRTDITVNDSGNAKITVSISEINPKKDIKVPLRTMKVNIKLIAVTSPFRNAPTTCSLCTNQYSFIFNNDPVPARSFELQTEAGIGDIAIVALAVEFETSASYPACNKDTRWLPAAVISMGRLK